MPDNGNEILVVSQTTLLKKRGYKIVSKIGAGSYAKVYLAEFITDVTGQTPGHPIKLAVKIIDTKFAKRDYLKKFLPRELNILLQLNHPHIIHIQSILQIGIKFYIFMSYAEQGDLLQFIFKANSINENQARVWTRQIALALQYLHTLNIAHRDLKCENVLVTMNYNAKLSDFGFARYTIDVDKRPVLSETYCGSLSYASPEILHGRPYNAKISDLWSFGVVIYVMLNKAIPFDDNNPRALYENQLKRNFKFRLKVAQIVSNEVQALVKHLLEPDPQKRYNIENVLKSDWIAMDKRLIKLRPMEIFALTNAVEKQFVPPEKFELPKIKMTATQTSALALQTVKGSLNKIGIIKPYNHDSSRMSENSKMPTKQP